MADNPNLTQEFIASQSRMYTGFFHKRFIQGLWVLCRRFNLQRFMVRRVALRLERSANRPEGQRRVPSALYRRRLRNREPNGLLDIYDDGKSCWVTREYYWDSVAEGRQKTDAEYVEDLVQFIGPARNAKVLIDPSAASFETEMLKRGIWHQDADNDVSDGIRMTSMALNQRMIKFCRETTIRTVQEMQSYAWDTKAAARGEEQPLKNHDHGPDALRYFVKSEINTWRLGAAL